MVSWILSLLMTLALQFVSGFHGDLELVPADDAFPWLQFVSGFCGELDLVPADDACLWLFRK